MCYDNMLRYYLKFVLMEEKFWINNNKKNIQNQIRYEKKEQGRKMSIRFENIIKGFDQVKR